MATTRSRGVVCVLGGTGFVGRRLAAKLAREGYSVRIPTRDRQRARRLLVLPGLELVQADVHDPEQLAALLTGCKAVINLVAYSTSASTTAAASGARMSSWRKS